MFGLMQALSPCPLHINIGNNIIIIFFLCAVKPFALLESINSRQKGLIYKAP